MTTPQNKDKNSEKKKPTMGVIGKDYTQQYTRF